MLIHACSVRLTVNANTFALFNNKYQEFLAATILPIMVKLRLQCFLSNSTQVKYSKIIVKEFTAWAQFNPNLKVKFLSIKIIGEMLGYI